MPRHIRKQLPSWSSRGRRSTMATNNRDPSSAHVCASPTRRRGINMVSPSPEPMEVDSNEERPLTNFIIPDPDDPSDEDYSENESSEPSEVRDADNDDHMLMQNGDYENDRPLAKRRRQRFSNTVDYKRFFPPAALRSPIQEADDETDAEDDFILADSGDEYKAALNASARDPASESEDKTQVRLDARSHTPVRKPHRPPERRLSSFTKLRNPGSRDRHHTATRATMTSTADYQSSKHNVMARGSASGGYDGDTVTVNRRGRPQSHQSPIPWEAIAGPDTSACRDEDSRRQQVGKTVTITPTRRLHASSSTEDRKPIRAPSGVRIFPRPKKRVFIEICDSDDEERPRKHVHGLPDASTPSSMSFTQPTTTLKMSEKVANDRSRMPALDSSSQPSSNFQPYAPMGMPQMNPRNLSSNRMPTRVCAHAPPNQPPFTGSWTGAGSQSTNVPFDPPEYHARSEQMYALPAARANSSKDGHGATKHQPSPTHVNGLLSHFGQHPGSKSASQTHHHRDTLNGSTSNSTTETKIKIEPTTNTIPKSSIISSNTDLQNSSSQTKANISANPDPNINPNTTSCPAIHTITALDRNKRARTTAIIPEAEQSTDFSIRKNITEAMFTPNTTTTSNASNAPAAAHNTSPSHNSPTTTTTNLASNPVTPTHPTTTTPPAPARPTPTPFPDHTEIHNLKHKIADLSDSLANLQDDKVRLESEVLVLRRELAVERRRGLGNGVGIGVSVGVGKAV